MKNQTSYNKARDNGWMKYFIWINNIFDKKIKSHKEINIIYLKVLLQRLRQ